MGLAFLDTMIQVAKEPAIRKTYEMRRGALKASMIIETSVRAYSDRFGQTPLHLDELVEAGLLVSLPADPYGGEFYLDEVGKVRTTSKFADSNRQKGTDK